MFTRCPQCMTAYALTAALISRARGAVRCGQCNHPFDALNFLFDQWPAGKVSGSAREENPDPPVLSWTQATLLTEHSAAADSVNTESEPEHKPQQRYWLLAATGLVLLLIANAAWTLREPLLQYPVISTLASTTGWSQLQAKSLLNTPEPFQLVSQDMHAHPTRSGILVLSLTLVNLAQQPQPFPVLEITLLNTANQPVARRRFQPTNYLRTGTKTKKGLATDLLMPVLLELADPGVQAVGFEIKFL